MTSPDIRCITCGMTENEPCRISEPHPHSQHSTIACLEYHAFRPPEQPAPVPVAPSQSVEDARERVLRAMTNARWTDEQVAADEADLDALIEAVRGEQSVTLCDCYTSGEGTIQCKMPNGVGCPYETASRIAQATLTRAEAAEQREADLTIELAAMAQNWRDAVAWGEGFQQREAALRAALEEIQLLAAQTGGAGPHTMGVQTAIYRKAVAALGDVAGSEK